MKTIKRLFILTLGVSMLIPNFIYAKSFKDLKKDGQYKWAYESVDSLSNKNILSGYEDGTFKPQRAVSFLEVLQIIKNIKNPSQELVQESLAKFESTAKNNSVPDWALEAVCYNLNINTITENTLKAAKDGGFLKDKNLTFPDRNSVTAYFARAFNIESSSDTSNLKHKDLDQVPDLVKGYLSTFVSLNIYADTGSNGYFNGKKHIRRAELAKISNSILNNIENGNIQSESMPSEDLKTDSLIPEDNEIGTQNIKNARIDNININGKESIIYIEGRDYKFDIDTLLVDGAKISPYEINNILGKKYDISLVDGLVVQINRPKENQESDTVELTVKVLSYDENNMMVAIMISNNPKYASGSEIRLESRERFMAGDILQIRAKLIADHLEDLKIKKI